MSNNPKWFVLRFRDDSGLEAVPFEALADADAFYRQARLQWSECYLLPVAHGPGPEFRDVDVHAEPSGLAVIIELATLLQRYREVPPAPRPELVAADQEWEDILMLRRLAVVGGTAMAAGYDAAPFLDTLPAAAEAAWRRLKARREGR